MKGSRGNATAKAILGSLAAFEVRYRLPVVWEPSEARAAALSGEMGVVLLPGSMEAL